MATETCHHSGHRVDVWRVDLDADHDPLSGTSILSADELERAGRFHLPLHQRRFATGRAALRRILAGAIDADPKIIRFHCGQYGKPELAENGLDVRFNLAHAGGRAVIAVCRGFDVGVDIEPLRPVNDPEGLGTLVFSDVELRELAQAADKQRAFLNGWTRKEAYIKAVGTGFSEPLRAFSVSLGDRAALLATGAGGGHVPDWTLVDLEDPGHVVALAARAPGATVEIHQE